MLYYLGIIIIAIAALIYLLLLINKSTYKKIARNIVLQSQFASDEEFQKFYIANAGVYYGMYGPSRGIMLYVTLLSTFSVTALPIVLIYMLFTHSFITAVICVLEILIILLTNTVSFFSFNRPEAVVMNYVGTNKKLANEPFIEMKIRVYDGQAHSITAQHFNVSPLR